jgi:soluble lytic murein transglycosylase-like protein
MKKANGLALGAGFFLGLAALTGLAKPTKAAKRRNPKMNLQAANAMAPLVRKWSDTFAVPSSLLMAIISLESGYNPNAVNHSDPGGGAWGLTQLLFKTAQGLTLDHPLTASQYWPTWNRTAQGLLDPAVSLPMSAFALSRLWNRYKGRKNRWLLAGLAWQQGAGGVDKYLKGGTLSANGAKYLAELKDQYAQNPNVVAMLVGNREVFGIDTVAIS